MSLPVPTTCNALRLIAKSGSRSSINTRLYNLYRQKLSSVGRVTAQTVHQAPHSSGNMQRTSSVTLTDAPPSEVPHTFGSVMRVFLTHPSAAVPCLAICGLLALRLQQPLTALDVPVVAGVVMLWLIQEWAVHKYLLHSEMEWMGKTIHKIHHETPYFHVSLDPPELIIGVMALAAVVFLVLFQAGPLSFTATIAYYTAGVVYEWLHYVVHTRWMPPARWPGSWLRAVRRHHMLHHCRNEEYWLSFTLPAVDAWFGTLPAAPGSVPLTAMARKGHVATAAAGKPAIGRAAAAAAAGAAEEVVAAAGTTAAALR